MVDAIVDRLPNRVDVAVVDEPAGGRAHRTKQRQLDLEAVAVQARALVAGRYVRQPMRRFEAIFLHQTDVHGAEPSPGSSSTPGFITPAGSSSRLTAARAR